MKSPPPVEVDLLHQADVVEKFVRDARDGNVVNVDLVAPHEEQQEVQRALELLQLDVVHGAFGGGRLNVEG